MLNEIYTVKVDSKCIIVAPPYCYEHSKIQPKQNWIIQPNRSSIHALRVNQKAQFCLFLFDSLMTQRRFYKVLSFCIRQYIITWCVCVKFSITWIMMIITIMMIMMLFQGYVFQTTDYQLVIKLFSLMGLNPFLQEKRKWHFGGLEERDRRFCFFVPPPPKYEPERQIVCYIQV